MRLANTDPLLPYIGLGSKLIASDQAPSGLLSHRFKFAASKEGIEQLATKLHSEAYSAPSTQLQKCRQWGPGSWATHIVSSSMPVLPETKRVLKQYLDTLMGAHGSLSQIEKFAYRDPYLCLCLLMDAEEKRSTRLGNETKTIPTAIM